MSHTKPINILIVDDSKLVRALLEQILSEVEAFHIIGFASNGLEAVKRVQSQTKKEIDIVLMDIMMPEMNGLQATQKLMRETPIPIIVLSSLLSEDEAKYTYDAMQAGALGAIPKFFDAAEDEFKRIKNDLIDSIYAFSMVPVIKRRYIEADGTSFAEIKNTHEAVEDVEKAVEKARSVKFPISLIALGTSTGGPEALSHIFSSLESGRIPVPIVAVIHISKGFLEGLVQWMQKLTGLAIKIATEGESLEPNTIYFAPDDHHLTIERGKLAPIARLKARQERDQFAPSITTLFESIAKSYPGRAASGLLTGMGKDGVAGLLEMRQAGCYTFIQTPKSCVVPGMPNAAQEQEHSIEAVPLDKIGLLLGQLALKGRNNA